MKSRAAIAFEAGKPLEIAEVEVAGPATGEVMIEVKATGVCHTDAFTLSGEDPEGAFPAILGHEGAGVVVELGEGSPLAAGALAAGARGQRDFACLAIETNAHGRILRPIARHTLRVIGVGTRARATRRTEQTIGAYCRPSAWIAVQRVVAVAARVAQCTPMRCTVSNDVEMDRPGAPWHKRLKRAIVDVERRST